MKTTFQKRAEALFVSAQIKSWNDLATATQIPRRSIYDYRDNLRTPNVHAAITIARALGASVEELWGTDGQ